MLLAAAVVAVALVPMLVAYVQLGYDGDVRAARDAATPTEDARRLLRGAVFDASMEVAGEFASTNRALAAARVNATLAPHIDRVESARAFDGVAVSVEGNATAARRWAEETCPSGTMRRFGSCETIGGLAFQSRGSEATLLGAAFDVWVTSSGRNVRTTIVLEAR